MICGECGVQVVAYTILDIISKVVFSFMIVSAHDSLGSTSSAPVQSREYV
jgi:bacteriorhodopsin